MKRTFVVGILALAVVALPGSAGQVQLCSASGVVEFNLVMPPYELLTTDNGQTRIDMEGAGDNRYPGYPSLPVLTYTFALPPGSEALNVEVSGTRSAIPGRYLVEASLPQLPLGASKEELEQFFSLYTDTRNRIYSGQEKLSDALGETYSLSERREYSLVSVALYPFYYDPLSEKLSAASAITVRIQYAPARPQHRSFIARFIDKGTLDPDVPIDIYNKDQAREWYRPSERLLASPRMLILTTAALKDSTAKYVSWRKSTGFDITVKTKEEVLAASTGADTPQKIRNWLRANAADYDYLLIVGHHADIPMRILTPFNNGNPGSYWDDPTTTPNPSDIYYGELSKPDAESWNKDGDGYWGEAMSSAGFIDPQDAPEMDMELHVGRINSSYATLVPHILEKTKLFESNTDSTYKKRSVLAGGILWYPDWNGSGLPGFDGAYYMEYLLNNAILNPSLAKTLYEKEGRAPSTYDCDLAFTQANLKSTLKNTNAGIFVENNHGFSNGFYRCVWAWDVDADGSPDDADFSWPTGLANTDAFQLNDAKPNVAFLLSCLNGAPEEINSLAQALLNYGSVAVVAHTRSAFGVQGWSKSTSGGQNSLYYHVIKSYLKTTCILGNAVDAGRAEYYKTEYSGPSRFLNSYSHTLYGDPALGHTPGSAVSETEPAPVQVNLAVDSRHRVSFSLPRAAQVRVEVWDVLGRRIQTIYNGHAEAGTQKLSWDQSKLLSGTYFITLRSDALTRTAKALVIR